MSHNTLSVLKAITSTATDPHSIEATALKDTERQWQRYAESRREVLRDQSEDRPTPRFIVAYLDNEQDPAFEGMPWKVYDLRRNPTMRGTLGRMSFGSAREATKWARTRETERG